MHKKGCTVKPKSEATQHHSGSKPTVRKTERTGKSLVAR